MRESRDGDTIVIPVFSPIQIVAVHSVDIQFDATTFIENWETHSFAVGQSGELQDECCVIGADDGSP